MKKSDVELTLVTLIEIIETEVLQNGAELRLKGFGTFKQKKSAARIGRNPKTGEELQISASKSVGFSASSGLKIKEI